MTYNPNSLSYTFATVPISVNGENAITAHTDYDSIKPYIDERMKQLKEKIYDILKDIEIENISKEEWLKLLEDC